MEQERISHNHKDMPRGEEEELSESSEESLKEDTRRKEETRRKENLTQRLGECRRRKIKQKNLKKIIDKKRGYEKPRRRNRELTEKLEELGEAESQNTKDKDREILKVKTILEEGMNNNTRLEILEDRIAGSPGGEKQKCKRERLQQEEHKARNDKCRGHMYEGYG